MTVKPVMVVGVDDSDHSFYALEWILDHFFAASSEPTYKLVIVHARPGASSIVGLSSGPAGASDVISMVDADLKRVAAAVVDRANELCSKKKVTDASVEVVEGDARNVMCEVVERHHAAILVVGSHGYGPLKRAVLGSVSDHCAHHAHCSVMIVKKPRSQQ